MSPAVLLTWVAIVACSSYLVGAVIRWATTLAADVRAIRREVCPRVSVPESWEVRS